MKTKDKQSPKGALSQHFASTFASLRHRNFQFYCLGVLISLSGSLMQEIVVAWIAFELTGSSFVLGSILFAYQVPMILLGVLGGYAADRFDRKRIVVITQVIALLISLTWFALALTGSLQVWHLYALSAVFGSVVAFEIPARFAMIPQLVEGEDTMNAFSLDSLLFYSGRVLGPSLGALALAVIGPAGCFALNTLSYALELVTLKFIKPRLREKTDSVQLKEAFAFAYGQPRIRRLLLFVALFSFCGVYIPLMPAFTAGLGGTETTNAMLIAFSEVGAMVGSVFLAYRTAGKVDEKKLRWLVGIAGLVYACGLALFAMSDSIVLSLALIMPTGLSMTIVLIGSHALVQQEVDDRMRGVVSTVFWMYSYFGMFALGGPVIGWFAHTSGLTATIVAAGGACALAATAYLRSARGR